MEGGRITELKRLIEVAKRNVDRFTDKNLRVFWENVANGLQGKLARIKEEEK